MTQARNPSLAPSWHATVGVALPQVLHKSSFARDSFEAFSSSLDSSLFTAAWLMEQPAAPTPHLHPLAALAAAAILTRRVYLGTAVIVPGVRNYVDLVNQLLSLDQLSEGRLVVGVGLGRSQLSDYFGLDPKRHFARFETAVTVLRSTLARHGPDDAGGATDYEANPGPARQDGPPLWFGGHAPSALERAGRLGSGWIGAGAVAERTFLQEMATFHATLAEQGLAAEQRTVAKRLYISVGDHDSDRSRRSLSWLSLYYGPSYEPSEFLFRGRVPELQAKVESWHLAGVDHVILHPVIDELAQLREVMQGWT